MVSEIAWVWEPPRGSGEVVLREMGEGVLVLLETGVFALSGETGEELWSYQGRGQELVSNVTSDGEYVVLHDEETLQTTVVERDTGQIAHEYALDLSEIDYSRVFSPNHLSVALAGVTGDTWIVRWKDSVSSYDLETGDAVWEAPDVPNCSDVGQVDDLSVQGEVVVAATTCFEQPEGQESVVSTVGQDFTSELVGLDPGSGEELWRVEHSVGRMPYDSLERTLSPLSGGWALIDFHQPSLGYSLFDVESREATHLETWRPVWVSVDGELLGLWDTETGEYQVRDRSGNVERTLGPGLVSMGEDFVADGHVVGLEGGVLYVEGQVENASAAEGFARFEGFEGSSALVWDQEAGMSVHGALSVPGAVTVLHDIDGERAVMGLR